MATTDTRKRRAEGVEGYFHLRERGTDVRTEVIAGLATWLTMAYILVVNPAILSSVPDANGTSLPFDQLVTVTALVAGVLTLAMGLFTNYPFAMAAGLGLNAFVAFTLVSSAGLTWEQAMGVIVIEGLVIAVLVLTGFREAVLNAIPMDLKRAIGIGIGLFIAFIGLTIDGPIVTQGEGTILTLDVDYLTSLRGGVFLIGFFITAALVARRMKGALLIGIVATTVIASIVNALADTPLWPDGVATWPDSITATPDFGLIGQFSFGVFGAETVGFATALALIISVMLSDFFDTMGTVIGVGGEAGAARGATRPVRRFARRCGGWCRLELVEHDLHRECGGSLRGRTDWAHRRRCRRLVPARHVPRAATGCGTTGGDGTGPGHRGLLHDAGRPGHRLERPRDRHSRPPHDAPDAVHVQHHERRRRRVHRLHGDPGPARQVEPGPLAHVHRVRSVHLVFRGGFSPAGVS
jgi:hypothetical protein